MKRALTLLAFMSVAAAGAATLAFASKGSSVYGLREARLATARFQSIDAASAAGYAELRDAHKIACIADPQGGMGVHYVNQKLVGDATIDPRRPEALVYAPQHGTMRLAALEYIVFAKAWKKTAPPQLFGRTFDYVPAGNRYGLPPFWALHAWVWRTNPTGTVMAWNPAVRC
jgi:hypothetical protein